MRRFLCILIVVVIVLIINRVNNGTEKVKLDFISVEDPQASLLSKII
ncbi:MAG TPA: hypothetical protein PLA03_13460 [Acidobacteriota bacterium]|nr:hypothetical protein [Acidobacteriota bacterium]